MQMEARSSAKTREEAPDRNVCTLQVPEESSKKGKTHEDVRSVPFDEKDPAKPKNMPVVDLGLAVHRPYVDPHYKPIIQKKRTFSGDK
ncbi:hypothetical protein LIER_44137 [Lithospermum erythrorhizon]|uniref:Uncharacterized protein n=1 Tax=Lithospermum erythrorhizon TaxID=34254 RepID=A0AAV3QDZ7_LITER